MTDLQTYSQTQALAQTEAQSDAQTFILTQTQALTELAITEGQARSLSEALRLLLSGSLRDSFSDSEALSIILRDSERLTQRLRLAQSQIKTDSRSNFLTK